MVLVALVALGTLLVPMFDQTTDDARSVTTDETLYRVRDAISGSGGYAELMKHARNTGGTIVGYGAGLPWPSSADILGGRVDHPQLYFLFTSPGSIEPYDPHYRVGWRAAWLDIGSTGRYVVDATRGFTTSYGEDDDSAPLDAWFNPIVIQLPNTVSGSITDEEVEAVRLVSAGPDGILDTPTNVLTPTVAQKNDDVVLYLRREDPFP